MNINLILLILTYLMAILDRGNLGIASLYMQKAIGASDAEFSTAISVFYFCYVIFAMPSLLVLKKVGYRAYFCGSLLLWAVATLGISMCSNVSQLIGFRMMLGAVESGIVPAILVYLSRYNKTNKLQITNIWFMCIPIGVLLSGAIGSIAYSSEFTSFNYHLIFIIEVILSFIIAGMLYFKFETHVENIEIKPAINLKLEYFKPFYKVASFIIYGLLWVYLYLQLTILLPIIFNKSYTMTPLYNAWCNMVIGIVAICVVLISNVLKKYLTFISSSILFLICGIIFVTTNSVHVAVIFSGIELGILVILISNLFVFINQVMGSEANKIIGPLTNTTIECGSIFTPLLINFILHHGGENLNHYINLLVIFVLFIFAIAINKWNKRQRAA